MNQIAKVVNRLANSNPNATRLNLPSRMARRPPGWQRIGQPADRMHRGASRGRGDLVPARKPVGDDQLFGFSVAYSGHEIGLGHGARDVLRLGLIAESAGHTAT